jgi:tRNA dimethylallyltransferase
VQPIIVILGPTATGKSDLAVALAKKYNGEIISADSRQIYKGMDIGSGKISAKEMHGVPHYVLDVVSPRTSYSVVKFQNAAQRAIRDIAKRGKLPIIVGGTGFWIDALVLNQHFPDVKPHKELRAKLAGLPAAKLLAKLQKLDPERAATIADPQNPVRLIRAIEIATAEKKHKKLEAPKPIAKISYDPLFIGLDLPDGQLRLNIAKRLTKRLKQGMANEALALYAAGLSWKRMESFGLEYRAMVHLLRDAKPLEEIEQRLNFDIWHYAKRQRSWFRRNKQIHWIDASVKKQARAVAEKLIAQFLNENS